jgi:hypothetical protein
MLRRSLLSMTVGVLLIIAPSMGTLAGPHNTTSMPHPSTTSSSFGFVGSSATNNAYSVSTALSTALSVGGTGDAASLNSSLIGSKKEPVIQLNSAPTVQTAIGAAVSIGGNASAAAINTNDISQTAEH